MKKLFLFFYSFLFIISLSQSQEIERSVISSTGYSISTTDFVISYTVGEPIGNVISSDENILIQGFEQARQDTVWVGIVDNELKSEIEIYPNPTFNGIYISVEDLVELDKLSVEVYSTLGQIVVQNRTLANNQYINLNEFSSGFYFVKILNESKGQFKVVKIEKLK